MGNKTRKIILNIVVICLILFVPNLGVAKAAEIDRNYLITEMSGVAITNAITPVYFYADTSKTIANLPIGTQIIVTGKSNGYYQIKYDGTKAYVNPKFTERYQTLDYFSLLGKIIADAPVYAIADTSKQIGTIESASKVMIIGKANGYYEIYYGNTVAFISPKYVEDYYPLTDMSQIGVAIKDMDVYTYADTSSKRGELVSNQKITIIGKANGYYKIKYGVSHGFVDSKLIGLEYSETTLNQIGIAQKDMVVYTFADTSHQRGTLEKNQRITIIGKSNGYYKIKYGESHGYVDSNFISDDYAVTEMNQIGVATQNMIVYMYADTTRQRGTLEKNQKITITGKANGYYRIKYGESHGFVDSKLIGLEYTETTVNKIGIAQKDLIVYTFADTSSQRGTLDKNQRITIIGKSNGYYKIKYGESHGYVDSNYISDEYAVTTMNQIGVATKDMIVYMYADTARERGKITKDQKITITGKSNGYYRIKYGDSHGFVDAGLIGLEYAETAMNYIGVAVKDQIVYSFADTSYQRGKLTANQKITIIGQSNGYYKIKYGDSHGYVHPKQIGILYNETMFKTTGITMKAATMYQFADTKFVLKNVAKSTSVQILAKANGYYKVKIGTQTGYINASLVDYNIAPTQTLDEKGTTTKAVNLYKYATGKTAVKSLNKGAEVAITGKVNGYYQIKEKKVYYYVATNSINLKKRVAATPTIFLHGYDGGAGTFNPMINSSLAKKNNFQKTLTITVSSSGKLKFSNEQELQKNKSPLIQVVFENKKASFDQQVLWIKSISDHLKEDYDTKKMNIVAHSMGGVVATKYILDTADNSDYLKINKFVTLASPIFGSQIGTIKSTVSKIFDKEDLAAKDLALLSPEILKMASKKSSFPKNIKVFSAYSHADAVVSAYSATGLKFYTINIEYETYRTSHTGIKKISKAIEDVYKFLKK